MQYELFIMVTVIVGVLAWAPGFLSSRSSFLALHPHVHGPMITPRARARVHTGKLPSASNSTCNKIVEGTGKYARRLQLYILGCHPFHSHKPSHTHAAQAQLRHLQEHLPPTP
jgi:UPF0716 family protein affecting phage T7 exclusion